MSLINIIMTGFMILSLEKPFCHGTDKYKIVAVRSIKELPSNGDIAHLRTYPDGDEFTEEKRLNLCREGFKEIRKHNYWGIKGRVEFLKGTSPERFRLYVTVDSKSKISTMLPAYKCPTYPVTYIHVSFNKGDKSQPIFGVLYKDSQPRPIFDLIVYEFELAEDIVEVNAAEFNGPTDFDTSFPDFDLDEFSEEQRRQICDKARQTIPRLDIKLSDDTKISSNKFYTITPMMFPLKQIREALECPTEPKIYIYASQGKTNKVVNLWAVMKANDNFHTTTQANTRKLKAISEKKIAEPLYLQLKKTNKNSEKIQILDPQTQHALCQTIIKDSILHKYVPTITKAFDSEYVMNLRLRDTYEPLKSQNPKLHQRLYKSNPSTFISRKDIIIVGGTDLIDTTTSGTQERTQEDVFVCLVRSHEYTQDIQEYYISKEYNVNTTNKDLSDNYVAGRFIFTRNSDSDKLEIVAMAEEFAEAPRVGNIELFYLERRKDQEPVKSNIDDPLCTLSKSQRSRFCSIVFDYYITTKKTVSLQKFGCAKNPITFTTKDGKERVEDDEYYEYMIPCYITETHRGISQVFYLSRAYNPKTSNEVFTYNRSHMSDQIVLQNLSANVSIGSFVMKK